MAYQSGLVGEQLASVALGFPEDEYLNARESHAERIKRIQEAQSSVQSTDSPGARGVSDLSADPDEARREKETSQDSTLNDTPTKKVRGKE